MITYTKMKELALDAIGNSSISDKDLVKNKYIDSIKLAGMFNLSIEMPKQDLLVFINNFIDVVNNYTSYKFDVKMVPTAASTTAKPDYKSLMTFSKVELQNAVFSNALASVHILKSVHSVKQNDSPLMVNVNTIMADFVTALANNITDAVDSNKVVGCTFDDANYYNATFNNSTL